MTINREFNIGNIVTLGVMAVTLVVGWVRLEARQQELDQRLREHIQAAEVLQSKYVTKDSDIEFRARVLENLDLLRQDVAEVKRAIK